MIEARIATAPITSGKIATSRDSEKVSTPSSITATEVTA